MPRQKEQSHTTRPLSTSSTQHNSNLQQGPGSLKDTNGYLSDSPVQFTRTQSRELESITQRQLSAFHPLQPSNLFPLRLIENSLARSFNQGISAILHHWSLDWRRQTANLYQAQEPAETVPTPPRRALCVCHSDQCFLYLPGSLITNPSFY